ncbi:hypothetical protein CPB84DRAFT_1688348 [Gymnopilus junonius]|uniref:MADS-box domain-containing protein n=1 Tax=Gymnopilus junonius TaxID=109634 RepID=A0A9P5ND30_GYMJU|nr:hypothetical protein CPB84DRAFT_1688348 [Gymnopilus junonius]
MGRRKIEIQPITHERNRSVTFLKRKNGLFKKAYELGVLCSVDVAVIIFEERPGHHVKLYQYGSSDIHDIVQRHMRHDGEKDTRGPQDFSNASASKLDDIGDGDDDDGDDDDDLPARNKRRHDGKLKPPPDMVTSNVRRRAFPSFRCLIFSNLDGLYVPRSPKSFHSSASTFVSPHRRPIG